MSNIIKRRKTANYTQINNFPVQEDLADLAAVGLLTYVMSLPADWTLYKTHLQKTFTRRKVDGAWKVLVEKKYAIGFYAHVNGHKNYFYMVSDIAFTQQDFNEFVEATIEEVVAEKEATVYNVTPIMDSPFEIPGAQNVQQEPESPVVQNVQLIQNSSRRTPTKEIPTKETKTNTQPFTIVNYQEPQPSTGKGSSSKTEIVNMCNQFYGEFAPGRWSKSGWNTLINQFVDETFDAARHEHVEFDKIKGYLYKSIENMARHHDLKVGKRKMGDWIEDREGKTPFYNWIEERD